MFFDILSYVGIIAIFVGAIYSFHRIRKQDEFRQLRELGLCKNLNLIQLIPAFFRKKSDPIKGVHVKLSKIGLWHVLLTPFSMLGYTYLIEFIEFTLRK
ncbi:hypothetical protein PsW64_04111 [Pseudovibrio sp. W64]|nr:hypothetical protein PsW64_04111 [Pseudovibrio sp. W64]